jgi:N-acetylneuraminic acid mutarotase
MYIYGGSYQFNTNLSDLRAYDPATDTWTTVSTTGPGRSFVGAEACVIDDRLYIYGGQLNNQTTYDSLWQYDFKTGIWTQLASGATPRFSHGVLVRDKKMYVFAGGDPTFATTGQLSDLWEIR